MWGWTDSACPAGCQTGGNRMDHEAHGHKTWEGFTACLQVLVYSVRIQWWNDIKSRKKRRSSSISLEAEAGGRDRWNPGQGWKVKLDTKEKLQWLPRCATRWVQMGSGRQVHARNHLWLPVAEQQSGFRYQALAFQPIRIICGVLVSH